MAAHGLGCVKTREAVARRQQKNRSCRPGESFMREQRSVRINLARGRLTEGLSHSQDPERTWCANYPDTPACSQPNAYLSIENERLERYGYARQDFTNLDRRVRLMQVAHGAREESGHAGTAASRPATEIDRHRMLLCQLE